MKKKIAILGATGSIGKTTLEIIRKNPDDYEVVIIANFSNTEKLFQLINEFNPKVAINIQKELLYINGQKTNFDKDYLNRVETYNDIDIVINGISGIAGLKPSISVLKSNAILATANKESFVTAGNIINKIKQQYNSKIIPLDSEHSTIWQCIGQHKNKVKNIILTASGGAFRDLNIEQLKKAKASDALKHPNWVMGKKVTIDCATLMNKGMEIIEAKHLFGINNIKVVQHKESIIHSMVEFVDNSIIAGLSYPDMTLPIQYALTYPERKESKVSELDFSEISSLNFSEIDEKRFPCFGIAKNVSLLGDCAGTVMNAANEVAVKAYLDDQIAFYDIPALIQNALEHFDINKEFCNINEVYCMDNLVSEYTFKRIYGGNR